MNLKKKIKIIGKEIKTRDLILIGIGFANLIFLLGVGVFLLVKKDSSTNQEVDNVSSKQELEEKTKFCQSERLGIKMIVPESWECKEKEVEEVEVDWSDEKGWNGEYLVTSDFFDIKFNFTGSAGYPVEEDYEVTTFFENETFKIRKYVEKDPSGKYPLVLVMGGIKDNFLTIGAVDIRWDYHYMSVETQLPKNQKDQILSVLNSVEVNRDLALKEELENNHKKKGPKEED